MIPLVARRQVIIMITTEADNDKTFKMSVKSMRISLDHFIYCIVLYKCKTIFFICGSIFSFICTVLIASVTIVHWLDNQKGV